MAVHYIGADVDGKMTNLAVEHKEKIVQELCVPTTIPCLRAALESIRRPRYLTFEEGPMAGWLARNLRPVVDELVVCDPRRNALVVKDGSADDQIDARKLATLYRGQYLRPVHHSDDLNRVALKEWVGLYHDRVREAVRQVNKLRGRCCMHGLRPPRGAVRQPAPRLAWLEALGAHPARAQLELLFLGLDAVAQQVELARQQLRQRTRGSVIVRYWQALPGVGPIRAITFYAYVETPWRFANNPHKLWKYCGLGLEHAGSGKDRLGRLKLGQLHLAWAVNRRLKDVLVGAAVSAINQGDNPFAAQYERLVRNGLTASNARHTVVRKLLSVLWGMWKTETRYEPSRV